MKAKEHHTMNAHEKAAHELLMAAVKEDGQPRDMDAAYREALDEIYSFKSVGGPFACMQPSRVLEECDPTAYRCGFSDWLDSEEVTEIGDEYFDSKELEDIQEQVADAMDSEITDLEGAIEDLESDLEEIEASTADEPASFQDKQNDIASKQIEINDSTAELEEKQAILAAVKAYTF